MRWIFWGFPYLFVFFRALFSLLSSALGAHPWYASNEEVKYCKWYAQPLDMKSCDRVSCRAWSFWLKHFWEKSDEADVSLTLILWLFWRRLPLLSLPLHFPALRWVRAQENKARDVNVAWRPYVNSILVHSVFVGRLCWISSRLKAQNYTGLSGYSPVDSSAISTDSDGNKKKGVCWCIEGSLRREISCRTFHLVRHAHGVHNVDGNKNYEVYLSLGLLTRNWLTQVGSRLIIYVNMLMHVGLLRVLVGVGLLCIAGVFGGIIFILVYSTATISMFESHLRCWVGESLHEIFLQFHLTVVLTPLLPVMTKAQLLVLISSALSCSSTRFSQPLTPRVTPEILTFLFWLYYLFRWFMPKNPSCHASFMPIFPTHYTHLPLASYPLMYVELQVCMDISISHLLPRTDIPVYPSSITTSPVPTTCVRPHSIPSYPSSLYFNTRPPSSPYFSMPTLYPSYPFRLMDAFPSSSSHSYHSFH